MSISFSPTCIPCPSKLEKKPQLFTPKVKYDPVYYTTKICISSEPTELAKKYKINQDNQSFRKFCHYFQ